MEETSTAPAQSEPPVVSDAVRLQILATEHWSLLATRSMLWNEMFTRTGMFITTLSAAAVALALVAQATAFGQNFRTFALIVLPVVMLLGLGTFLRLNNALEEDVWLVVGMNRLRHAYLGIAPDLRTHFVTSSHDDLASIIRTSSTYERAPSLNVTPGRVLSSTAAIVGILNCVLAGLVAALVADLFVDRSAVYVSIGAAGGLASAAMLVGVVPRRSISRLQREYRPRFPAPPEGQDVRVAE
jgi:hypothetical protein